MAASEQGLLERRLGLFDLICIVMGAIVGVGVFFTPAKVAKITGSPSLFFASWGIGAFIALTGALTFSELGAMFPRTGGLYHVLREAYGRGVGFLYGWALLTVIQSGAIGIIAILCVQHLARCFGSELEDESLQRILSIGLIALLTALNAMGLKQGSGLANLTMILKAGALLAIALIAFGSDQQAAPPSAPPAMGDGSLVLLFPALVSVMFSFGGWQQGLYIAGEVKNVERALPRGLSLGVFGVGALYLAVNYGFFGLLGLEGVAGSKALAADAVGVVFPDWGGRVAAAAVALSALGVASVCILTAPRMYKAMSDDGVFFKKLAEVHPRWGTPSFAICLQGGIASLLVAVAGFGGVDALLTGVVCLDWCFFALGGGALFVLRRRRPELARPFRVPLYPLVPGLFVLSGLGVLVGAFMDPKTAAASWIALVVLSLGVLFWVLWGRRRGHA